MQNVFVKMTYFVLALVLTTAIQAQAAAGSAVTAVTTDHSVKSYREWKNSKISEIEVRIKNLKEKLGHQSENTKSTAGTDPNLALPKHEFESGLHADLQSQLEKEMLTLSMSKDLTISDYFVGYLTKQTSLDAAIREVSTRMTPDEVADLMVAFAEHFFQTRPTPIKAKLRTGSGQ